MSGFRWLLGVALLLTTLVGCGEKKGDEGVTPKKNDVKDTAKPHPPHGPNGGHLADINEKLRAEVVYMSEPKQIAVFVLNHDDSEIADVKLEGGDFHLEKEGGEDEVEMTVGMAKTQAGESAQALILAGDKIPAHITGLESIHGHLHITIDGEEHEADFGHDDDEGGEPHKH